MTGQISGIFLQQANSLVYLNKHCSLSIESTFGLGNTPFTHSFSFSKYREVDN